ncbi:MAG: threonine/serine dehydratase, partial [Kiloniellaceae bacterium]
MIAYSSGNHAQAVASAARLVGTRALIVMPDDAPSNKVARTRELGARIVTYDRSVEVREEVAARIGAERNRVMVPPNEDARVLAGAGTVALELVRQAEALGATPDAVLVPCGGGGLTAATALVFEALSPATKVFGVEPELFDDTRRSLEAGERLANPKGRTTICDAIMTDRPGALTFSINRERLGGVLTVSDDDVRSAMKLAFDWFKIVVEPGAAVGLAAVFRHKLDIEGKTIAVIATGGNVDAASFCAALDAAASNAAPVSGERSTRASPPPPAWRSPGSTLLARGRSRKVTGVRNVTGVGSCNHARPWWPIGSDSSPAPAPVAPLH